MCTVVKHCRNLTRSLTQAVILYDDEGNTSHSEVLLGACIDAVVLSDVDRTAEDIRRHIADKSYGYFRLLADFGTINSIVCCDMQIVEVCRAFVILRIEGIASVSRRCYFYSFAYELSLFQSLLCPCTCVEIACLLDKEVERNHAEFQRSTTTEEQYRVAFWHLQEFLNESNCLINNRLKIFCTMANLSQRKT